VIKSDDDRTLPVIFFSEFARSVDEARSSKIAKIFCSHLKGLGHTILGNFSIDQMVREFTDIKITSQNYRRAKPKHRRAKKGHIWTKRERVEMDGIWEICRPTFFQIFIG